MSAKKIKKNGQYVFECFKIKCVFEEWAQQCECPIPRSGHRVTACDTYLYSYGGFNPAVDLEEEAPDDSCLFKEIWKYNLITKEWVNLNIPKDDFPEELASMCLEKVANNFIVYGGTGTPFGFTISNVCHAVNINTNSITKLETSGLRPEPRYGQAACLDDANKKWYVVGGTSGHEFFMDVFCLDIATKIWTELGSKSPRNNTPPGRYRHELALYDNKILVFGGGTLDQVFGFQELPAFDLKTEKWETLVTLGMTLERTTGVMAKSIYPHARRCHAGVMVPDEEGADAHYIISGGMNGAMAFNDIWSLNLRTLKWRRWKNRLPHRLFFHDATLTSYGKMIIFGGVKPEYAIIQDIEERTNEVMECWVRIPKLSEMAWDALRHYLPKIHSIPVSDLKYMGIPRELLNRLR